MTGSESIVRSLPTELLRAARLTLVVAVVTGLIYPFVVTGVAQVVFHDQANGSLISKKGQLVGSRLIGQNFTDPKYFFGRPSATLNVSDATKSPSVRSRRPSASRRQAARSAVSSATATLRPSPLLVGRIRASAPEGNRLR